MFASQSPGLNIFASVFLLSHSSIKVQGDKHYQDLHVRLSRWGASLPSVSICLHSLGWPFREQVNQQTTCHIHHKRSGQTHWQRIARQIPSPSTLIQSPPCKSSTPMSPPPEQSQWSDQDRERELHVRWSGPWPPPRITERENGTALYYVKRKWLLRGILVLSLCKCSCCEARVSHSSGASFPCFGHRWPRQERGRARGPVELPLRGLRCSNHKLPPPEGN